MGNLFSSTESIDFKGPTYMICHIRPMFTIVNEEETAKFMSACVEATDSEEGCVYYGWTRSGDKLFCREAYKDGDSVVAHFANAGPLVGAAIDAGHVKLEWIEFHGPASEIAKVKGTMDGFGTTYYATHSGNDNFADMAGAAKSDYSICSIHPYFTILDWEKAKPVMAEFVEATNTESGMVYYGWTVNGTPGSKDMKLCCREAYTNGDAILAHLENVGPFLDKMLKGDAPPAKLDGISFMGPAAEIEKIKPTTDPFGSKYFVTDSGFSKYTTK